MSAIKSNAQFVNYECKSFIKLIPGYFVSMEFRCGLWKVMENDVY